MKVERNEKVEMINKSKYRDGCKFKMTYTYDHTYDDLFL